MRVPCLFLFLFFTSFRDNGTPGPHTGSNAVGNERPGQRKEWSVSEAQPQAGAPSLQRGSHALWPQGYGGPLAASMRQFAAWHAARAIG